MDRASRIAAAAKKRVHPTDVLAQTNAGAIHGISVRPVLESEGIDGVVPRSYHRASATTPLLGDQISQAPLECQMGDEDSVWKAVGSNHNLNALGHAARTVTGSAAIEGRDSDVIEMEREDDRSLQVPSSERIVQEPQLSPSERTNPRAQQFIDAFITTPNGDRIANLEPHINRASVDELLSFTTTFKAAVQHLLDPDNRIVIEDQAIFKRISLIMKSVERRRLEIALSDYILTTIDTDVAKKNSEVRVRSMAVFQELEAKFQISEESKSVLQTVKSNLGETFDLLKADQQRRIARLEVVEQASRVESPEGKRATVPEQELSQQIVIRDDQSSPSSLAAAQEDLGFFDISDHGPSDGDFEAARQSITKHTYDQCLFYFHQIFLQATKSDGFNSTYPLVLKFLTDAIKQRNAAALASNQNVKIAPASSQAQTGGVQSWFDYALSFFVSPKVEPPPLTEAQLQQQREQKLEQARIAEILANKQQLTAIQRANPELTNGRANALESLCSSKIALIIQETDLAITEGPSSQQGGVAVESKPEEKSSWSLVRFGRWLFRTSEEKIRYRKGIEAVRAHVAVQYGPPALKRFDAHFALRYRTGSPLTVRAVQQFLQNEKALLQPTQAATENPSDLLDASESQPTNQRTALLTLNEETTVDSFSVSILDRAKLEFDLRYYGVDRRGKDVQLPQRKEISKEDECVLFAAFYQEYLKRPVVLSEKVSREIRGGKGVSGFFSTRWNALWTTFFPGDNSRINQELEERLTDWIMAQGSTTTRRPSRPVISEKIKQKLEAKQQLTLEDVDQIIKESQIVLEDNNTWGSFFYYRVLGNVSRLAGTAAVAAVGTSGSSVGAGAAQAAALGAALYLLDDRPEMQLSAAVAGLWAASHPHIVGAAENSIASGVTDLAKNAAIGVAGLHFPPLWLLYLF